MDIKVCKVCNKEKPLSSYHKSKIHKLGCRNVCKPCRNKRQKISPEKRKESYSYEKNRNTKLKQTYGITYDDYLEMFNEQDSKCLICSRHQKDLTLALAVDHCHDTGMIRGLLCGNCNSGIGNLRDDISLLKKAIEYLESYENKEDDE